MYSFDPKRTKECIYFYCSPLLDQIFDAEQYVFGSRSFDHDL